MHTNEQMLHRFFGALACGDYQTMQGCLHPAVEFKDIGFELKGKQVHAMWHMLCTKDSGIRLLYRDVSANDLTGNVYWECDYEFQREPSSSPRHVHNKISSEFRFEDGLIRAQQDTCDFETWAEQALGIISPIINVFGTLTGHQHLLEQKVRESAKGRIDEFVRNHPQYA
jgi:hypothetical protein